jgi:hypothetical protein
MAYCILAASQSDAHPIPTPLLFRSVGSLRLFDDRTGSDDDEDLPPIASLDSVCLDPFDNRSPESIHTNPLDRPHPSALPGLDRTLATLSTLLPESYLTRSLTLPPTNRYEKGQLTKRPRFTLTRRRLYIHSAAPRG